VSSPDYVLSVHRRYAEADYYIISTNTQGLPTHCALAQTLGGYGPVHWMDLAWRGIGLARRAVSDAGRADECAVAFNPSVDIDTPEGQRMWTSVAASTF
jgi:methionine synthase I (cobalamin-dependent)